MVTNITAIQTRVVTGTVSSSVLACALGSASGKTCASSSAFETIADAASAAISLHALTRHQYQRRIITSPTPAVRLKRYFHASPTDVMRKAEPKDRHITTSVRTRDAAT